MGASQITNAAESKQCKLTNKSIIPTPQEGSHNIYVKILFMEENHDLKSNIIKQLQNILTAPFYSHSVGLRIVVVLIQLLLLPWLPCFALLLVLDPVTP